MSTGVIHDSTGQGREVAYYSTVLGQPCRIMNHPGTPKPREECQPFTFELHDPNTSTRATVQVGRSYRLRSKTFTPEDNRKAQEKFIKQLAALEKKRAKATA